MKVLYPAIFKKEKDYYFVSFPDFNNCETYGNTLLEAYVMARECLELLIVTEIFTHKKTIPTPSNPEQLEAEDGAFITLIYSDFDAERLAEESKENAEYKDVISHFLCQRNF